MSCCHLRGFPGLNVRAFQDTITITITINITITITINITINITIIITITINSDYDLRAASLTGVHGGVLMY